MGSGCICIISNGEVNDLAFVNIAGISAQNKFVFTGFQTYKSAKVVETTYVSADMS